MEPDVLANGNTTPAAAPQSSIRQNDHLTESLKLEDQLMRVPFEHLKKSMRASSRMVEKEMNAVVTGVAEAVERDMSKEEAVQHLTSLVSRLQGLKRKLDESNKSEQLKVQKCRVRLDHLSMLQTENQHEWNSTRVKRILVDYMLRLSYYDTAMKLAESCNIQDLVDIDVFMDAKKVVESLQNGDCAPALAWCAENKYKLKKSKSKFEFQLRKQEFIELVRVDQSMDAIAYARKHLAQWGKTYLKDLQQAMATLAFKSNTDCATYKILFDAKQWDDLVQLFKQEFCKLYGMTLQPLLNIYLQAGLTALKTPFCYEENCTKEDPLSQADFRNLASSLPFSKHIHSKLVCYISKELMDEHNPPLVLPNGYVYSTKALEEMAKRNNGKVTCPRTGLVCNLTDLQKAFIS
ncbi:protein MAEA homolog [Cryptomeria japonica]|uniref:protein MAEA homolog n=1 Tax=Cryptomeria japonica TaxID=3369 RepID=UPI0027DAA60E|nr:protein MAEA homolog [Cryptomeria japonica]XP_057866660.2 protein MAEA homolog [Cryptomeria japonica]XP_057866662.2 protein MAEA homolog [Cryptomeria japonica]